MFLLIRGFGSDCLVVLEKNEGSLRITVSLVVVWV
jgi:hypothetical protein